MKSKPTGALFGVLALAAILSVAPAFGQTATEVDIAKGASSGASADCVTAKNYFCTVHPWMTGQVIVSASAATPPTSPPTTNATMPSNSTSGNNTVPEFGSIAPIVLAIAVISIVVFTARNRGIPKL